MKYLIVLIPFIMTSCQAMPELYQSAEDVLNDNAVRVEISREAMPKGATVNVTIDIKNAGTP